ncbi:dorsal-ventral patterning tolloid-like protein 1 [Physella acuta]|uniref:dorsal-ventral patterning tolloid-like protein 1 n=1 Tax=Physella acuta TaxID=109671 RepID=UPI0027DB87C7|nr:dorsal-ventral patterning tolloid-like protein 1 [Physella acuta]
MITSPNYPHTYPASSTCFWRIPSVPKKVTTITFLDLKIETDESCQYDYLKVYNGSSDTAPLLQRYCGSYTPDPISSNNDLYLVFRSDLERVTQGFQLFYSYENNECDNAVNPCHRTCTSTLGNTTCSCQEPGYIIDSVDSTRCKANYIPCGAAVRDTTGFITSPNYPQYYPGFSDCSWIIPAKPEMVTIITFQDFELQASPNCNADYVKIFNGTSESDPLLQVYCDVAFPDSIRFTGNLYVVFHSNNLTNMRGFKAVYTYEMNQCKVPTGPYQEKNSLTTGNSTCSCPQPGFIIDPADSTKCKANYIPCNTAVTGNTGLITGPIYPISGKSNFECAWTIPAKPQMVTTIRVLDVVFESSQNCSYSFLTFINGTSKNDPVLQQYCDLVVPKVMNFTSNLYLIIHFQGAYNYWGFKLAYTYD